MFMRQLGYKSYEPVIRTPIVSEDSSLLFKDSSGDSGFAIGLKENRIWVLFYFSSKEVITPFLNELKRYGWTLSRSRQNEYEVYENKAESFFTVYNTDLENGIYSIQFEKK